MSTITNIIMGGDDDRCLDATAVPSRNGLNITVMNCAVSSAKLLQPGADLIAVLISNSAILYSILADWAVIIPRARAVDGNG
jgi:hypothetical protein